MTDKRPFHLHDGKTGAAIKVRITPRSSKNEIYEILNDGTIKVRITAGLSSDHGNQALIEYLSGVLDVSASTIEIVGGMTGMDKLVTVMGLTADELHAKIIKNLD